MTIVSKPASQLFRDNYDAVFGKARVLPKSFAELWPICKFRDDERGACAFFGARDSTCSERCPAFAPNARLADFIP